MERAFATLSTLQAASVASRCTDVPSAPSPQAGYPRVETAGFPSNPRQNEPPAASSEITAQTRGRSIVPSPSTGRCSDHQHYRHAKRTKSLSCQNTTLIQGAEHQKRRPSAKTTSLHASHSNRCSAEPTPQAFHSLADLPPPVMTAHGSPSQESGVSNTTVVPTFSNRILPAWASLANVVATSCLLSMKSRHVVSSRT